MTMVVAGAATGLRHAGAAGSASVHLTPPSSYVQTGSTVDVYVEARNLTTGLGVYEFRIEYDPAILELVGVENASFLGSTGRLTSCSDASEPGTIDYHCNTNTESPPAPTGGGRLAEIRFRGLASGDSALHFTKIGLDDIFVTGIEVTDYSEAVIQVGDAPPADPDGDDDGSGGDGASTRATPTKVPRALTPTIPVTSGTPVPAFEDDVYNPSCAGAGSCVSGGSSPGGTISGGASGGATGGVSGAGAGAPVAGTGPPPAEERIPRAALGILIVTGGLLIFLGGAFARKRREVL